jgi:hypothetical protein
MQSRLIGAEIGPYMPIITTKTYKIMKLLSVPHVKVGDKVFPVKITYRARVEYENMTGRPMSEFPEHIIENTAIFFFCTAKAGAREFKYTYEEFINIIDDHFDELVTNFSRVITESNTEDESKKK